MKSAKFKPIHLQLPMHRVYSNCHHRECQRKSAYLDIYNKTCQCKGVCETTSLSQYIENVVDLANTLAHVMITCCIHPCKAKNSVDVITYALLNYDEQCYCSSDKKRIRKEDLFFELSQRLKMDRLETHIAYTIIKRAFKALYFVPKKCCNEDDENQSDIGACVWANAAKRIAEELARYKKHSCTEQRRYEKKILALLSEFYIRTQEPRVATTYDLCNCCFCSRHRKPIAVKPPPCKPPAYKPICCKKQIKITSKGKKTKKPEKLICPICLRLRKNCICFKGKFELQWVGSIWEWHDFHEYYKYTILGGHPFCTQEELEVFCEDWFDPPWLNIPTIKCEVEESNVE
ncbi:uncharacterized protein LOC119683398 [Teleopsis dalmanni]|uniref:uncharacterized protein LOC119677088 n=1 Tax=Teleopsis dalmanni TaxID=139649 RepID=UPI0018CDCAF6|nr:uncharacterized protein LOC119677088 [Teleopsis dalmanni]XP_037952989.1 uncharacterized protein LOC119683398 [Teleopsis dalmanni]